jgi:hypothetical protein
LVLKRRPETPLFFAFVLAALAIYGLLDIGFANGMVAQVGSKLGTQFVGGVTAEVTKAQTANLRLALFGLIWSLYWIRSKRVAVMFAPADAKGSSSGTEK